jgi:phage tail-like protein
MDDTALYPLPAFHFALRFSGEGSGSDASFQEVGSFGPEMDVEAYREGGENRFVHQLPKGIKSGRLTLKRGIAPFDSPLVKWCRSVLEGMLSRPIERRTVQLSLLNEKADPVRVWVFDDAWPAKWTVDGFRSNKNEVALESIELFYGSSRRTQ